MKKVFTFYILLLLFSCNKDLEQGEASLKGTWKIVSVETVTVNFEHRLPTDYKNLGNFTFKDTVMDYFFIHNQDTILGSSPWKLTLKKQRESFFKVNKFKLQLEDFIDFNVNFEDGTKNAEKDARKIQLVEDVGINPSVDYLILHLVKQ